MSFMSTKGSPIQFHSHSFAGNGVEHEVWFALNIVFAISGLALNVATSYTSVS